MQIGWIALALIVGFVLPLQAGINAQLRTHLGSPIVTAAVSFIVGTLALLLVILATRSPLPGATAIARAPWWHWTGGFLGALYIAAAVILAPRLGATALVALIVGGQMVGSLILDHWGLVGYPVRPVTSMRIFGVVMLMGGMYLVVRTK
jgi:bacterial/archaeal transporter family-2 protein